MTDFRKQDRYFRTLNFLRRKCCDRLYNSLGHLLMIAAFYDKKLSDQMVVEIASIYYSM